MRKMKPNFKFILCLIIFLTTGKLAIGQDKESWSHDLGINLLQLPATTLDLVYEFSNNPRYTLSVNSGYTINYAKTFDIIGFFLSPHYKCGNNGYIMKKQSGGFVKIGMKFNFRKESEKMKYFYLGAFLSNSLIYERADYENWDILNSEIEHLSHNVFIFGLTGIVGYNFRISNKLNSDFGVQISIPTNKYNDLYGYCNYIPGMGFMETCGNERVFPMLVLNLKYRIR
ncbi:MAG TPA: hypothetical protein PLW77_01005 [Bacteroidales bacterium]|nr:hypothetical protein [Bacteroidales bacterium]